MSTSMLLMSHSLSNLYMDTSNVATVLQEPEYTVYTDRVSTCSDYVWYTGENLNANSALHVGP